MIEKWGLGVFKAVTDPSIDKLPNWSPKGTRHPSSSAVNRRQSRRDNLLVLSLAVLYQACCSLPELRDEPSLFSSITQVLAAS